MDSLLRAAVRRRELETALLSADGDHAAKLRCLSCGKILTENAESLQCISCGRLQGREKALAWELVVEARRAQLERVAKSVDGLQQAAQTESVTHSRRCSECGRRLELLPGEVCQRCVGTRAKPIEVEAPEMRDETAVKTCARSGCGRRLRSDNVKGVCSMLKNCGGSGEAPPKTTEPKTAIRREVFITPLDPPSPEGSPAETLRRFRLLAEAIGFDPDEALAELASSWLARAGSAVRPTSRAAGE